MRSTLFQIRSTDAFKRAPHKTVKATNILGSKSPRYSPDVAAPSQSRHSCHSSPPSGATPGWRNLNGPIARTVTVVWKRTKHALRRGILTGSGSTLTILQSRKKPWSTLESAGSRETSLAGAMYANDGSEWSLV